MHHEFLFLNLQIQKILAWGNLKTHFCLVQF